MKLKVLFLIISCFICRWSVFGQDWVGSQFSLDTSITLHYEHRPNLTLLKSCLSDSTLYFAAAQAFQDESTDYTATVYALSLRDYQQTEYHFPLPTSTVRKELLASSFWINDMDIQADRAVLSVQDHLVLYHRGKGNDYCYDTMFYHRNAIVTYFYQGELYFLAEDHDRGYQWYHLNAADGTEKFIRELPYEAPHVVQAAPNLYLFHNQQFVFFLSTRYPVLHKYNLNGQWIEDITFDLPNWHPFEDEYIQKSLSIPYGAERIYGTMAEIFKYSYPKVVFPLDDGYLLYYTQYDTLTHRSTLQYALRDADGQTKRLSRHDKDSSAYRGDRFPFNLFDPFADKARLSGYNSLIEICEESDFPWDGYTPSGYLEAQEVYFKQHEPTTKVRIMHYKNSDCATRPFFYDTNRQLHTLHNLPKGKAVLLINNVLECSACKKLLLAKFNSIDTTNVHIGILFPFIPGALQERELRQSIREYLYIPHQLYYLATDRYHSYPHFISNAVNTYPAILFYESGKAPIFLSSDNIFVEDPYSTEFSDSFKKAWQDFLHP